MDWMKDQTDWEAPDLSTTLASLPAASYDNPEVGQAVSRFRETAASMAPGLERPWELGKTELESFVKELEPAAPAVRERPKVDLSGPSAWDYAKSMGSGFYEGARQATDRLVNNMTFGYAQKAGLVDISGHPQGDVMWIEKPLGWVAGGAVAAAAALAAAPTLVAAAPALLSEAVAGAEGAAIAYGAWQAGGSWNTAKSIWDIRGENGSEYDEAVWKNYLRENAAPLSTKNVPGHAAQGVPDFLLGDTATFAGRAGLAVDLAAIPARAYINYALERESGRDAATAAFSSAGNALFMVAGSAMKLPDLPPGVDQLASSTGAAFADYIAKYPIFAEGTPLTSRGYYEAAYSNRFGHY